MHKRTRWVRAVYESCTVEGLPLDERELIARARRGDVSAYEDLVRAFQDIAHRAAYLIGGADDAEDAVQEAFVKAYRALPSFRDGSPFRPWLLRIVSNEARNRRRAAGRRANLALRIIEDRPTDDAAPSPEEAVLVQERRQALAAAIGELREEDRLVVTCRYLLQLSEAETAETLGIPAGTVKSRLSRSLAQLRGRLAEPAKSVGAAQ
jgi:RNA polymerase sigma-70 factor (ECF subfamily)